MPDDVYERVRQHFSEQELIDLTLAVAQINTWNRLNVALRTVAGGYRPGMYKEWDGGSQGVGCVKRRAVGGRLNAEPPPPYGRSMRAAKQPGLA